MATVANMLGTFLDPDLGMVYRVCIDCGLLTFAADESRLLKHCLRCGEEMQAFTQDTEVE